jgi:hypothetical protein
LKVALLALVASALLLAAAGCGGDDSGLVAKRGRSLEIHSTIPEIVEKVAYTGADGRHRVIRPVASNRRIAVAQVTIVNRTTTVVPLLVDEAAAEIGDRRSRRVEAVDPVVAAEVVDTASDDSNEYVPFLWGKIELARDTQVSGWMVFDVPQGMTLGTLWWNEVDDILVDYIDYRR